MPRSHPEPNSAPPPRAAPLCQLELHKILREEVERCDGCVGLAEAIAAACRAARAGTRGHDRPRRDGHAVRVGEAAALVLSSAAE